MKTIWAIILSVLGLITRFFNWKSDPARLKKKDQNENSKIIAAGDESALNKRLDDKLRQ